MSKLKITEWNNYKKGEANCYSWKLNRVQAKITDSHYINNFVDFVINENKDILRSLDKILLLGNGNPIALFPKVPDDLNNICIYLESIKNTDIHTIVISMAEDSLILVDSDLIEDVLARINSATKIEVRFIIEE